MANERYAAFDGKEALDVLQPADTGAVVVAHAQRRSPFFFVERLGDRVITAVLWAASLLWRYGFAGVAVGLKAARYLLRQLGRTAQNGLRALASDVRGIHRDLSMLRAGAKLNAQNRGKALRRAYRTYFLRSLRERKRFWQGLCNAALPLLAVLALAVLGARLHTTVPALEVRLHDSVIGYAADERTARRAMDELRDILPQDRSTAAAVLGGNPTYRVRRVPLSALSGSAKLSEALLAHAKAPLVRACGIFIDGSFLCAVRNESDAVAAFAGLIAPVREKAAKGRTVAFVEEITYVQGLYADDPETLWDPVELKRVLRTPKSEAQYHTVQAGDTVKTICKKAGIDETALRALNPDMDPERLTAGQKLLTAAKSDYVHIKELEYYTYGGVVPFETIRRESDALRAGTTKLLQTGENGRQVTTAATTYLDGKKIGSAVVSVQQTKAPVQQILLIGTGSPYQSLGDLGGGSARTGWIWPAVGAYALSSGFGYRSARISGRSFHGGVDIVKPGGHSTGAPVIAAAAGRVIEAHSGYRGYGHTVVIDHGDGLSTRYAHMQSGSITVKVGQKVTQGQQLGRIGSTGNVTGPHLHFEVMKNGVRVNPMNYIG